MYIPEFNTEGVMENRCGQYNNQESILTGVEGEFKEKRCMRLGC